MAHSNHFNIAFNQTQQGLGVFHTPQLLANLGLNLLVELSTASAFTNKNIEKKSCSILGLVDTGATRTSIDKTLAQQLNLIPIGMSTAITAAGPQKTNDYAVDLTFIGSQLRPVLNLRVGSCTLNFDFKKAKENARNPKNIGLLIGRDVMSRWNLTWHGPTSTVFISD